MARSPDAAPDPVATPEGTWRIECSSCSAWFLGETSEEVTAEWGDHADKNHSDPLRPSSDLYCYALLNAIADPGTPEHQWAARVVRDYFLSGQFAGSHFERVGADESAMKPNAITARDLHAVSLVGEEIHDVAAVEIRQDRAADIAALLSTINSATNDRVPDLAELQSGSASWRLRALLASVPGISPVTANNLLARKRPHLIPVQGDRVIARLLPGTDYWTFLWDWLGARPWRLHGLRLIQQEARMTDISLLRVLDIAVWRYDRAQRRTSLGY